VHDKVYADLRLRAEKGQMLAPPSQRVPHKEGFLNTVEAAVWKPRLGQELVERIAHANRARKRSV